MSPFKPSQWKYQAEQVLHKTNDHKKMVLIHTGVSLGITLLITVLNFILSQQIENTGGLSGIGLRSILSTVQSVLEFFTGIALPFWEIGLLFVVLCWVTDKPVGVPGLLQGFRKFGSVLGMQIFRGLLFTMLAFTFFYFSIFLFMLTPLSTPLANIIEPFLTAASPDQLETMLTVETMQNMVSAMIPVFVIFAVLFLPLAIPLAYRLRFAEFAVMEDGISGLIALLQSFRATKGKVFSLIKLDLSFLWYYLAQILCTVLCFGDLILPALNITIPFSSDVAFFLFYIVGILCQGLLYWQFRGKVMTTYALVYQTLRRDPPTARQKSVPRNLPWD